MQPLARLAIVDIFSQTTLAISLPPAALPIVSPVHLHLLRSVTDALTNTLSIKSMVHAPNLCVLLVREL
jgi:hypothetical protein